MTGPNKSLAEISHEAIRILGRELGVVNTIRFLGQFHTGYGNYTEERKDLFKDLTLEETVAEIRRRRDSSDS